MRLNEHVEDGVMLLLAAALTKLLNLPDWHDLISFYLSRAAPHQAIATEYIQRMWVP